MMIYNMVVGFLVSKWVENDEWFVICASKSLKMNRLFSNKGFESGN